MRAVNLLPDDLKPRQATGALRGSSYALIGALGLLLVMAVVYVLSANQANDRKTQIATVQQETAEAEARAAELAPYEAFAQVKATRIASVKDLADRRFDWERLMRELALVLPAGTSLTDLTASTTPTADGTAPAPADPAAAGSAPSGPTLALKGCAEEQPHVATLMVRLHRLYRASDVQLSESTEQDSGTSAPVGSGAGAAGCPRDTYLFNLTVSFEPLELEQSKRVPARLGGGA